MINLTVNLDTASVKWKKAFPKMKPKIEQAAAVAFLSAKKPASFKGKAFDVNILLTTNAAIRRLNHDFRGMDKPTNVLSFPQIDIRFAKGKKASSAIETVLPLGDVVLAFETIKRECKEQEKTLENHTIHLVVHGVLHLLGYDHMKAKDAKAMEKLECDILDSLGYPDPYHETIVIED